MKVYILLAWTLVNFICSIILIVKEFKSKLDYIKVLIVTIFIIIFSPIFTYVLVMIARYLKNYQIIDAIGTSDAWIGFAGSIIGGSITMFALYLTFKHESRVREKNRIDSIKPYISCRISNYKEDERKIDIGECVNDYGHIQCVMKNISNNIGNIKFKEQFISREIEKNHFEKVYNLDQFGISTFAVQLDNGFFLAPHETYKWNINFGLVTDDVGNYKFENHCFSYIHTILFEITDVSNTDTYIFRFDFEVNINIDKNNKPTLFLEKQNNSIER